MVVWAVGSLRLHACTFEASAFLSERINRVIITGRYLRHRSDLTQTKRDSDVHDDCTVVWRKIR